MYLTNVPSSLRKGIEVYCRTDLITIVNIVRTIGAYKDEYGFIPTEWGKYLTLVNQAVNNLQVEGLPKEFIMKNVLELEAKRLLWISEVIEADVEYTVKELNALSMIELRDLRDELLPMYVVATTGTITGKSTKITKVKAA